MQTKDLELLKQLCHVHAPPGREVALKDFILSYVEKNSSSWALQPKVLTGGPLMDCVVMVFGKPRTAVFAHMDSVGFTVRYGNQLVSAGSPKSKDGTYLVGNDSNGAIECRLQGDSPKHMSYSFNRPIEPGTMLTFKPDFRTSDSFVQCCSLDNRIGVFTALKLAETITDGALVFSCQEETGGGSVAYLAKYIFEEFGIQQALISDVTWVTDGIEHGKGVAISRRDSGIPRQSYVDRIMDIMNNSSVTFQVEVESAGGSDGNVIHKSPYPIDWCFIGPPEDYVHSPDEKVHIADINASLAAYRLLMEKL